MDTSISFSWFKPWGWIYRPVAWQAWVITLVAGVFCVQVFMAVDRHSHSASDTLYGVFPYFVPAIWIVGWVASHTAAKPRG
jgi:hypothetical protein